MPAHPVGGRGRLGSVPVREVDPGVLGVEHARQLLADAGAGAGYDVYLGKVFGKG